MTEHRYLSSLVDLYQGQKFAGIVRTNLSKMGLSKIAKIPKPPPPGNAIENPVEISSEDDITVEQV